MPNYNTFPSYNYTSYPTNSYQQQYSQAAQQAYVQQPVQSYQQPSMMTGICWVDGEVGAKAQQLPPGWDTSKPFPMWDTNDQIIYLKSFNAMGMPNPLTKLHYTIEESYRPAPMMSNQAALPSGDTGTVQQQTADMSQYVRKEDLERMKEELKEAMTSVTEAKGAKGNGKSAV